MSHKKKVHKLEGFGEPLISYLGIVSQESDFRLIWLINRSLGLEFLRMDDISPNKETSDMNTYSHFRCLIPEKEQQISIYKNKNQGRVMIPQLKNFDYIIKLVEFHNDDFEEITLLLKNIKEVLLLSEFDFEKYKTAFKKLSI